MSAIVGQFTLAVIRDVTAARQRDDLVDLRPAGVAEWAHGDRALPDGVVSNLLNAGSSLRAAIDLSDGVAAQRITEAISGLDGTTHEIQYEVFGTRTKQTLHAGFSRTRPL